MKTSLNNLPNKVSNWKEHPEDTEWGVVDWGGEFFKNNSHLIPQGEKGCCMYSNSFFLGGTNNYLVHLFSVHPLKLTSLDLPFNFWNQQGIKQCDALIFPTSDQKGDALLFIETKYSIKTKAWKNYKKHALEQITDTISQLSNRGCPIAQRKLYGLISCPLLDPMGASVFSPEKLMKIYMDYKLEVHIGNSATFQDAQNISFI